MANYRVTTAPATEPVSLTEMKSQVRVDITDEDTILATYIAAARQYCEVYTNRAFITQTITQEWDCFTNPLVLGVSPVVSLTTLKYYDTNESQQTITDNTANIQKDFNSSNPALYEGLTNAFPSIGSSINPIEAIYVAGYGASSVVPDAIKHAIKLMVSHLYENREMVSVPIASMPFGVPMPKAVEHLLAPYRTKHFG